jgi:SPX domain protein involved in polyphosphate accumulation
MGMSFDKLSCHDTHPRVLPLLLCRDLERCLGMEQEAQEVGRQFLELEKYVNVNYLGFHKILKKHDKNIPTSPCSQFYIAHLHQQPWVQVALLYSLLSLPNRLLFL